MEAEGFIDIDAGGDLLKGVTMADCGNITVVPSDGMGNFDKLTEAVEKAVEKGLCPLWWAETMPSPSRPCGA